MDKVKLMEQISVELDNFSESPLYKYRVDNEYYPVIGEGDLDAKVMFIGEAPGKKEAETAKPFCGASGRVLDELLDSINLNRQSVYVTNVVKDRPQDNRDPTATEVAFYTPFLRRQIDIIEPTVVATLGRFAMDFMLNNFKHDIGRLKISEAHGQHYQLETDEGTEFIFAPLYHPAVALYNGSKKVVLLQDFKILSKLIS